MKKLFYVFILMIAFNGVCYGDVIFISGDIAYKNVTEDTRYYVFKKAVENDLVNQIKEIDGVTSVYKQNRYEISIYKTPFYSWREIQMEIINKYDELTYENEVNSVVYYVYSSNTPSELCTEYYKNGVSFYVYCSSIER